MHTTAPCSCAIAAISATGFYCAEHIRHMAYRHHSCAGREETSVLVDVEYSAFVAGHHFYYYAATLLQELPGHDVGVVLHYGENYFVARLEKLPVRRCHEVDGFGCAACKNHFVGRLCVDKLAHTLASGLHIGGGFLREAVYAAVNVGLAL